MVVLATPVFTIEVASKRIQDANDAAAALTGYARAELIGKTLGELYAPETVVLIRECCVPKDILSGKSAFSKVGRGSLRTKRGRSAEVELYCHLIPDATPTLMMEDRPLRRRGDTS